MFRGFWNYKYIFEGSFYKLTLFSYSYLKGYKLRVPYRHLVSWIPFIHNLDNFAVESLNREGEKDFKEKREGLFVLHGHVMWQWSIN